MVHSLLLKTAALVSSTLLASTVLANPGTADGNQELVTLRHPSGSSAEISVLGVQVISFRSALDPKTNVLFMSGESSPEGVKRGGISVVFPNVAADGFTSSQFGFARSIKWIRSGVTQTTDANLPSYAVFRLEATDATLKMWPYKFELMYEVILWATSLESKFIVNNQHSTAINFNALLQNHVSGPSVADNGVVISGLQGVDYFDIVTGKNMTESRASFAIASEIDNIYKNVENSVTVAVKGEKWIQNVVFQTAATYGDGGAHKYPTARDHVVFNPWSKGSKAAGFGDEGYRHMVAIGSGRVSEMQDLSPSLYYILHQTISVSKQ